MGQFRSKFVPDSAIYEQRFGEQIIPFKIHQIVHWYGIESHDAMVSGQNVAKTSFPLISREQLYWGDRPNNCSVDPLFITPTVFHRFVHNLRHE